MPAASQTTRTDDSPANSSSASIPPRRALPRWMRWMVLMVGLLIVDRFALAPWHIDARRLFLQSVPLSNPDLSCCGGYHGINTRALGGKMEQLDVLGHFYTEWLDAKKRKARLARSVVLVESLDHALLFLEARRDVGPYWVVVHILGVSSDSIKILAIEREDLSGGSVYGSTAFGWEKGRFFQRTAMLHERVQYAIEKALEFPPIGMN
jgi:hypothetical protein